MFSLLLSLFFAEDTFYFNNLHLVTSPPVIQRQCDNSNYSNYETWFVASTIYTNDILLMKRNGLMSISHAKTIEEKENVIMDIVNRHIYLFSSIDLYKIFWEELVNNLCEIY